MRKSLPHHATCITCTHYVVNGATSPLGLVGVCTLTQLRTSTNGLCEQWHDKRPTAAELERQGQLPLGVA